MADYCTQRDLKDVYPNLDEFDAKTPLYNWVSLATNVYVCRDSGLITTLFQNGQNLEPYLLTPTTASPISTLTSAIDEDDTTLAVSDEAGFTVGSVVQIESEKVFITAVATKSLTVIRGIFNTTRATHADTTAVGGISLNFDAQYEWYYDSTSDAVYLYCTSDPNDLLMESGEDYATLIARYITNASRYFDSMVNSVLPTSQFKNADGTYDYVVIRTTALLATAFLIRSSDPMHPKGEALYEEAHNTITGIIEGNIKLIKDVTADASKGTLKTITHTSGKMLPVDTRGNYSGTFDIIKIKVTTAGVLGTAKFTASVADSTALKGTDLTATTITGQYDTLYGGLEIRFAADGETSTWQAALNDEWELLVHGKDEVVDRPSITSLRGTRL